MLRDNRLLWILTAFVGVYWLAGAFLPGTQLTALASVFLLFGGLTTLRTYAPVSYRIVFLKLRNEEIPQGYGAHLAVLGTTMLAAGAVWSGFASAAFIFSGSPAEWLQTPVFGFGRYLMAGGFMFAHVSPSMTHDGLDITKSWVLWLAAAALIALGIFIGATLAQPQTVITRYDCPADQPIKGNRTRHSKIYHLPGTANYGATIPEGCYASEVAVAAAGYRKAGS